MRIRLGWILLIATLWPLASCISMKTVMVDSKTQLENQILGSFRQLQEDLVLASSVRGEGMDEENVPAAHREALNAMMHREFNLDDVNDLRQKQVAGEGNDALLRFFDTERTQNDAEYAAFAKRIAEEENHDRTVIMKRVIAMNPNLSEKDLPTVRRVMHKLCVESSPNGTRVQEDSGEWIVKGSETGK